MEIFFDCPGGGIGRHAGLKILFAATRVRVQVPPGAHKSRSNSILERFFIFYMQRKRYQFYHLLFVGQTKPNTVLIVLFTHHSLKASMQPYIVCCVSVLQAGLCLAALSTLYTIVEKISLQKSPANQLLATRKIDMKMPQADIFHDKKYRSPVIY